MKIAPQKITSLLEAAPASKAKTSKYQLIYSTVKAGILGGELPNNCELPPSRTLAETLGVSRSTVIKVYELLKLEGLLEATIGSGHRVVTPSATIHHMEPEHKTDYHYAAISESAMAYHKNLDLINAIDDPGIAFRPGIPPLDLFPISRWKKLSDEYWKFVRASELSYYAGAGVEVLRKTMANYLNLKRGVKCEYNQVFILSGSLQSLFLIGNLLLNPGDEVLLENPSFPNAHSVFKSLRAKVTGIEVDSDGIDASQVSQNVTEHTKLIHLTPSCQYPLNVQMSLGRKQELLQTASARGLYIIENDYENEINFPKRDGQTIFSLDKEDRTFYLGTFNRTLHPSIRVGFVVVPQHLIQHFHAIVMHTHRFVSPVGQVVLRSFIEKNFLHEHLRNVSQESDNRRAIFSTYIENNLSKYLTLVNSVVPSLHLTALLKNGIKDNQVVESLAEKGIIAHALSKCYISEPKQQGLIFGFASVNAQHMTPLLARMAEVLNKF